MPRTLNFMRYLWFANLHNRYSLFNDEVDMFQTQPYKHTISTDRRQTHNTHTYKHTHCFAQSCDNVMMKFKIVFKNMCIRNVIIVNIFAK